jgi:hypothetical protein
MTGSVDVDDLKMRTDDQIPFNQWGQYLIVPQGGKKPEAHTRVTTFAATLDDRYGLERWGLRMAAIGFTKRPDLLAGVAAARPDDKTAVDKLVAAAKEAAAASASATTGTALHGMCERTDLGEEITFPAPWDADVAAYRAALDAAGIVILPGMIERYVVLPDLKLGGKLDRIVSFGSTPKIADLKTGATLDYSWGTIAVQLACYANAATLYNGKTQKHTPMPDVDKDVALVIHLPAGQGQCTLWCVDIAAGWQAATHATWVRGWRKRKDLAEPMRWDVASSIPDVRRARLVERLQAFPRPARQRLADLWPLDTPTFKQTDQHTPEQLDMIALAMSTVEAEFQLEFGQPDPIDTHF